MLCEEVKLGSGKKKSEPIHLKFAVNGVLREREMCVTVLGLLAQQRSI